MILMRCVFAMLLVVLLGACGSEAPEAGKAAPELVHEHTEAELSTVIKADMAKASGIRVQPARSGIIADEHVIQGLLTPLEDHMTQAVARYAGPVREIRVGVGDHVRAGQIVAVVDSNLSLSRYSVRSPITGVVTARHASVGSMSSEGEALLDIADLTSLWVDLHVFGDDAGHIRPGASVRVIRLSDGKSVRTKLERVLPGMATASQSTIARARIVNADGQWRPGAAVKARVTVAEKPVALVVPLSSMQTMDGKDVVFVREGETYTARPVQTGARDAQRIEIIRGLAAGENVVVAESYLIKADILKMGAAHEH